MHDQSLQVVFFSPTKNTQKILAQIAGGMNLPLTAQPYIDITSEHDKNVSEKIVGDIILFGVPVYISKIPSMVRPVIAALEGNGRWIIPVAISGHVTHGECLENMIWLFRHQGFRILAAGKFIGRHSFTTPEFSLGETRPNSEDIHSAREFGKKIADKLRNLPTEIVLQGISPSEESKEEEIPECKAQSLVDSPVHDAEKCVRCRVCYAHCPVNAIDFDSFANEQNPFVVDEDLCFRCFGCVYVCPFDALSIQHVMTPERRQEFLQYDKEVQLPEVFLA
ncbi:MAG: EFR1 family ferrodoxin [Promethearchaeota archaeon]